MVECPLCNLDITKETVFYEDDFFIVLRTNNLKGHRERMMIMTKDHVHIVPYNAIESALDILDRIGRKRFHYTSKFVIMDSTFATIKQHWHLVVTDLDPHAEDFEQIINTKWLKVIDRTWD